MNTNESPFFPEHFYPLIELLHQLNTLHSGISQKGLVQWKQAGDDLVITGVPTTLSALISLLWSTTQYYAFYMTQYEGSSAILVKYIR